MSDNRTFNKDNLDAYLKELGREFRKRNGSSMPAEIILVGGAAIIAGYQFRQATADIDAIIIASSAMENAVRAVGDKYALPHKWINADFRSTASYSDKLYEVSKYYRTFSNVLQVRTVSAEYLIAMKLMAGRRFKNDFSDIIGILKEHDEKDDPIPTSRILAAFEELYGSLDRMPPASADFLAVVSDHGNIADLFDIVSQNEESARSAALAFEGAYPELLNDPDIDDIINAAIESSRLSNQDDPEL